MNQIAGDLLRKIERREARAGVVGLGYVGLPLAVELARVGFRVTGIDLDERRRGARHDQHLCADTASQDEGPRHVVHRVGRR